MISLGLIGFGYWGPNLARNFAKLDGCRLKTVVDIDARRLAAAQKNYPQIHTTSNVEAVLDDRDIDAIIIASPVSTHYELARKAIIKGKHVFIEKPMARSKIQAEELIEIANRQKKILMVDHTFLYTGAVRKMKEVISAGTIGDWQYFDSTRVNLGLFQNDINVVWDLAPHDLSIMNFLVQEEPSGITATGISQIRSGIENLAYITLFFSSNKIAHFSLSWTSPVKIRKILIGGTKKMIVYDDIEPTEKVKVYDSGYIVRDEEKTRIDYRTGDIHTPKTDLTEALSLAAADFLESVQTGVEPVSNSRSGLAVVRILEAADASLKNRGKEILLT